MLDFFFVVTTCLPICFCVYLSISLELSKNQFHVCILFYAYMHTYIYICICNYRCIYTYRYVCIYIHTCIYFRCVYIHTGQYIHVRFYTSTTNILCPHVYTYVYMFICVYVYAYIYMHSCIVFSLLTWQGWCDACEPTLGSDLHGHGLWCRKLRWLRGPLRNDFGFRVQSLGF